MHFANHTLLLASSSTFSLLYVLIEKSISFFPNLTCSHRNLYFFFHLQVVKIHYHKANMQNNHLKVYYRNYYQKNFLPICNPFFIVINIYQMPAQRYVSYHISLSLVISGFSFHCRSWSDQPSHRFGQASVLAEEVRRKLQFVLFPYAHLLDQ